MAMGKISEFDIHWTLYTERLEMYFKVNGIQRDLWLPTLIAVMGDAAYELLSNLISPRKPSEGTYEAVVNLLRNHLQPKRSVVAERYYFRLRRQLKSESVLQYISELKKLTKYCEFGAMLEESLRDQLVCGLTSDVIRQRLFAEDGLDYAKAVRIACALEAAERDAAAVELMDSRVGAPAGTSAVMAIKQAVGGDRNGGSQRQNNYLHTGSEWK
ncbi:uncharacterized protein LOC131848987 [Achroia grisella]|uniref:uncharacterized protein LOC131848987 n=1 Tax=Achroia grisella TaxID=688607 RepID=UPI0027D23C85|nr:uncharacterized protein LOC131848987 [Achroia grisella]